MRIAPTAWQIWAAPRHVIAVLAAVDLLAAVVPWLPSQRLHPGDLGVALLLASLSITYSVTTVTFERVRVLLAQSSSPSMCPNLLSTWIFAGAVLLPMRLAAAVVVVAAVADWPARNVARQTQLYRYVYSNAGVMLSVWAVNRLQTTPWPAGIQLLAAGVTFVLVGAMSVALAIVVSGHAEDLRVFLDPREHRIEIYTVVIGATEIVAHSGHLPLVWLSLPAAIAIQQWSGRDALRRAGDLPDAMGEVVWLHIARGLVAGCSFSAVLRVDTNEATVLRAITTGIQSGCDAIGRYGQGLAILLVDCPPENAEALRLRLQAELATSFPSARVAMAAAPRDGGTIDELLVVTEAELSVDFRGEESRRVGGS